MYSINESDTLLNDCPVFTDVDYHINFGSNKTSFSSPFTRHMNVFDNVHTKDKRKPAISDVGACLALESMSVYEFITNNNATWGFVVSNSIGYSGNDILCDLIINQKPQVIFKI